MLSIVPLSAENWEALSGLFAAGGDPKWCWCQFWRKPGSNWSNTTADDNRADLAALVGQVPAPGLVALRDDTAVGWVGLGPRGDFGRLARSRTIPHLPGDGVWVVNCFVVAKTSRRAGVASALLDAAVGYAREHGARVARGRIRPTPAAAACPRRRRTSARSRCSSVPGSPSSPPPARRPAAAFPGSWCARDL